MSLRRRLSKARARTRFQELLACRGELLSTKTLGRFVLRWGRLALSGRGLSSICFLALEVRGLPRKRLFRRADTNKDPLGLGSAYVQPLLDSLEVAFESRGFTLLSFDSELRPLLRQAASAQRDRAVAQGRAPQRRALDLRRSRPGTRGPCGLQMSTENHKRAGSHRTDSQSQELRSRTQGLRRSPSVCNATSPVGLPVSPRDPKVSRPADGRRRHTRSDAMTDRAATRYPHAEIALRTLVQQRWIGGVILGLALTGCGSNKHATTIAPYLSRSWSALDQGSFVETCDAHVDDAYCVCALGDVMNVYPNPRRLPDSIPGSGFFAAERKKYFPDCRASSSKVHTDPQDR